MFCHNNKAFLFCLLKISQLRATKGLRLHPKSGCSRRLRLRNTEQNTTKNTYLCISLFFTPPERAFLLPRLDNCSKVSILPDTVHIAGPGDHHDRSPTLGSSLFQYPQS